MNSFTKILLLFTSTCLLQTYRAQAPLVDPNCVPGELYEGPTCATFTKCVESRHLNLRIKFDCPPGTYFNANIRLCDHDYRKKCLLSGPTPPSPFVQVGSLGGASPPAASPPGTSGGVQNFPPIPEEVECPQYDVDITGVYECPEPGYFPSYGDCHTFYRCINSMGCIVKGFYTSCPNGYLFDSEKAQCTLEEIIGPCTTVQDQSVSVEIKPVIQLTVRNMREFFNVNEYWRFMKFMPNETQRIIFPDDLQNTRKKLVPSTINNRAG